MNKYVVRCLDRNGYGKQKWMGYALGLSAARSMVDNMSGAVLGLSYDNAMGAFCAWHDGKMYCAGEYPTEDEARKAAAHFGDDDPLMW